MLQNFLLVKLLIQWKRIEITMFTVDYCRFEIYLDKSMKIVTSLQKQYLTFKIQQIDRLLLYYLIKLIN